MRNPGLLNRPSSAHPFQSAKYNELLDVPEGGPDSPGGMPDSAAKATRNLSHGFVPCTGKIDIGRSGDEAPRDPALLRQLAAQPGERAGSGQGPDPRSASISRSSAAC